MNTGYIENGFIVDLSNAKKTSEIIYELSQVLDMPESKEKHICLKLGSIDLSQSELTSIKALVEIMNSQLAFISTSSTVTLDSATALGIKISEFTNQIEAPTFDTPTEINEEAEEHLTTIFGEPNTEDGDIKENTKKDEKTDIHEIDNEDEIAPLIRADESDLQQIEENQTSDEHIEASKETVEALPTLYLRKTIRSGQSISSDGNIVVIGDVNPGAEVIAKGDITVWGILGGIAQAGSDGNNYARIRALKLNPVQIRIGTIFARRPDTVNIPYIQKSSEYIPEEAFTYNDSIIIRKIHEEN